jgi:hypothetical protein
MANSIAKFAPPPGALERLPDTDRYKCRFKVRSQSSNQLYLISFDAAPGALCWKCSCPGCVAHGQCKHLTACGLKGRPYGRDPETLRRLTS